MTNPEDVILPVNPVDKHIPMIAAAIQSWHKENNPAKLTKTIHEKLDKSASEVLLKVMGFNKNWHSEWEVDHCNGRNGASEAGDYLKQVVKPAVDEWMAKVHDITLTEKETKQLMDSIRKRYVQEIENRLRYAVQVAAQKHINALVEEFVQSNHIEAYGKLTKLINQEG